MIYLIFNTFIFFNIFYVISLLKKDFSIIDTAWALSFILIFVSGSYTASTTLELRTIIVGILTVVWAIRLSGYIFYRSYKLRKEDYRYAQWREQWGKNANVIAYFKVFMLQAIFALIIASPLYLIHQFEPDHHFGTVYDYLGILLWLIGFSFEVIGDYQKQKFKSEIKNQGKVMQSGLWKYTRHPNYFGEALLWWGIFLIVINQVPIYAAIIGPLVLNFLLIKVSGVAMLERKYVENFEYDSYKKATSSFIPWFTKK